MIRVQKRSSSLVGGCLCGVYIWSLCWMLWFCPYSPKTCMLGQLVISVCYPRTNRHPFNPSQGSFLECCFFLFMWYLDDENSIEYTEIKQRKLPYSNHSKHLRNAAKDFLKLCTKRISISVYLVTFYWLHCIAVDRLLNHLFSNHVMSWFMWIKTPHRQEEILLRTIRISQTDCRWA